MSTRAPAPRNRRRAPRPAGPPETLPGLASTDLLAGRYALGEEIARGRVGVVRAARDTLLDRDVALKVLELGGELAVTRALRAARAASAVADQHVVGVLDVDHVDGVAFVALPLLEVTPLDEVLAAGPPRPAWARALADDLLRGLGAIHAAGTVHRDVSAENVLLLPDGSARLTCAGLSAAARDEALGLRVDGGISTAAPALADPDLRGDVADLAALLRRVLARTELPDVDEVLERAADPDQGPRDARELRTALAGAGLGERSPDEQRASADVNALPATTQLPAVSRDVPGDQRRRLLLAAAAAGAVGVLLLVLILVTRPAPVPEPEPAPAAAEPTPSPVDVAQAIPGIGAPLLPVNEQAPPSLEQVLANADAEADQLGLAGSDVVERLRAREALTGDERAAETADLFGTAAVAVATDAAWSAVASDVVDHLRPELDVAAVLALADRDPALLDPFFNRLVSGLQALVPLEGEQRVDAAAGLLPDLELAATEGTISPALSAAAADVLARSRTAPAVEPTAAAPAEPTPPPPAPEPPPLPPPPPTP